MKELRQNKKTRPARKARRRPVPPSPELQEELSEVLQHRAAISEVLRAIASSPHDLQPIFDTMVDSAMRLCRADGSTLRLHEEDGFRLVAITGSSGIFERFLPAALASHSSFLGQLAKSGAPMHVPDLAAHEVYRQGEPFTWDAVNAGGVRTLLVVPMVKDEEVIGLINIARARVQPFTDKQIELITDFAAQAAIALEITRRERQYREAQMKLAHANRVSTMGLLTASIAHELKQPLSGAAMSWSTGLYWLTSEPPDIEKAKLSLERVIRDINRASDVIGRIHNLVRKNAPQMVRLDINDVIIEIVTLTHSEAVKNDVTVQTQLADHLPRIRGDRVQLQQVMLNLIINAIQAMSDLAEDKRELHISTQVIASGVHVAVGDSGPGLSAETLQHLFETFYTTKPNGMGMGLAICRSIVEDHGGRLWVTRHQQEQGALFQFTIPAPWQEDRD